MKVDSEELRMYVNDDKTIEILVNFKNGKWISIYAGDITIRPRVTISADYNSLMLKKYGDKKLDIKVSKEGIIIE